MLGYEKVNNKRRRVAVATPSTDRAPEPTAARNPRPHPAWLVDLSVVASEPCGESIARENEIVARLALADDYAEQPSEHGIAEQLQGLVDPDVIRSI
jgi:hypothetical protein